MFDNETPKPCLTEGFKASFAQKRLVYVYRRQKGIVLITQFKCDGLLVSIRSLVKLSRAFKFRISGRRQNVMRQKTNQKRNLNSLFYYPLGLMLGHKNKSFLLLAVCSLSLFFILFLNSISYNHNFCASQ
jgi:hypothetical protein